MKIFSILVCALFLSACSNAADVRQPAVAGMFYPDQAATLKSMVDDYLSKVPEQKVEGELMALIVPHAGYLFSGQVAAYAFKQLENKAYETVIVIGPSHQVGFDGIAVDTRDGYMTPLGEVKIDKSLVKKIIAQNKKITFYPAAFKEEHSVEVEIPFLQRALKKEFKLVPIVMGNPTMANCEILAKAIVKSIANKNVLLVASSDMSHYYSYNQAVMMDKLVLADLEKFDLDGLTKHLDAGAGQLCGQGPVIAVLLAAKQLGADKINVLKYANSGDVTRDKSRVVGYSASAITKTTLEKGGTKMLNKAQQEQLLKIARQTIETYLSTRKKPDFNITDKDLQDEQGAFVTLHKNGDLKGCIGNIIGRQPLWETVRDMAIESATGDPRFSPVTKEELKDIDIEISVLTKPERVKSADQIIMGTHGVIVRKGFSSGVFLPQVATET
ncbi:MAG: AmmeMemoRadiSam system protein B, partial [bacterium]